ncbi:MAG: DUF928 domain-containing protein [Cyanobacteria bacterium J06648_16]
MKLSSVHVQFGAFAVASLLLASTAAQAFTPPNVRTRPNLRRSGGTRDPIPTCLVNPSEGKVLTAAIPEFAAQTTLPYPVVQWFMPENTASYLEFQLYQLTDDDDLIPVYQMAHALSGEGGIATLALPEYIGVPPLAVGSSYYWSVEVYCEAGNEQADMSVFGYIDRVEASADVQAAIAAASTPVERANIAADNGLWHDAVTYLVNDLDAPDAQAAWGTLMEAVDLAELVAEPLIQP